MTIDELCEREETGFLHRSSSVALRAPEMEGTPHARVEQHVIFVAFLKRGLSVPVSDFVLQLVKWYGIQLHHLTPRSIAYMSCFVAFCEGYLGIRPNLGLWRFFFFLSGQIRGEGHEDRFCGVVSVVPRWSKLLGLELTPDEEACGQTFFYCSVTPSTDEEFGLPPFTWGLPVSRDHWDLQLPADRPDMERLRVRLEKLLNDDLTGLDLFM